MKVLFYLLIAFCKVFLDKTESAFEIGEYKMIEL